MKKCRFLSNRAFEILKKMKDEEEELVVEKLECWVGLEKTSWRVVKQFLLLCLIRSDSFAGSGLEVYYLNEDGEKLVEDPENYIPRILQHEEMRGILGSKESSKKNGSNRKANRAD